MEPDDPIGIGVGQRTEQHAVDDAEDRRCGADAETERQDRNNGEGLGPEKQAHAVTHIAKKVFEERRPVLVPRAFLEILDATEPDKRLPSRFVRGHSGAPVLLGLLIDVKADLLVESTLALPSVPQTAPQFAHVFPRSPLRCVQNQVDGA